MAETRFVFAATHDENQIETTISVAANPNCLIRDTHIPVAPF